MQAERERRAKVLEAQGDKEARIARSEGQKIEQINLAGGAKEAEVLRADGEAMAVERVAKAKMDALNLITAVTKDPKLSTQFLIANSYLEAFQKFAAQPGDKVFIPYEASTALGSLGSIKELLMSESKS
jgi:regulator of protease activity HflC (stomatin/prohibitin superfamily)